MPHAEPTSAMLDQIDGVLRLLDREVWVVTAADGSRRGGLAATWVSPASIHRERPVLLAAIAPNHFTAELIDASQAFAAHLLRADQAAVAWNFAAGSSRQRDKFAGLATTTSAGGSPLLADCRAWCDCRVITRYDTGDRLLFWADVVAAGQPGSGPPLREQGFIRNLSPEQRQQLTLDKLADIAVQRPLHRQWRAGADPAND
ncbi:MAG: flavin reductase family protein [Pirellulaceae bacterium]